MSPWCLKASVILDPKLAGSVGDADSASVSVAVRMRVRVSEHLNPKP